MNRQKIYFPTICLITYNTTHNKQSIHFSKLPLPYSSGRLNLKSDKHLPPQTLLTGMQEYNMPLLIQSPKSISKPYTSEPKNQGYTWLSKVFQPCTTLYLSIQRYETLASFITSLPPPMLVLGYRSQYLAQLHFTTLITR
jgi:hypothetical protein